MTSNRKQFTAICKMLTAVPCDQNVQWNVVWCCRWNLSAFFTSLTNLFWYITNHLFNDWSLDLREQWILFPSNLDVSQETLRQNGWGIPVLRCRSFVIAVNKIPPCVVVAVICYCAIVVVFTLRCSVKWNYGCSEIICAAGVAYLTFLELKFDLNFACVNLWQTCTIVFNMQKNTDQHRMSS